MKKKVRYIYASYTITFIIIIIISILYSEEFNSLTTNNAALVHAYEVKNKIQKIKNFLFEAENNQRGFLLINDSAFVRNFKQSQVNIYNEISQIKNLVRGNIEEEKIIAKLTETVSLRYRILYQPIYNRSSKSDGVLGNISRGDSVMQQFILLSDQLDQIESKLLNQKKSNLALVEIATSRYLKLILLLSFCFQLISFLLIVDAFKKRRENEIILENKIQEVDIAKLEMEQMTFVASHDLQEPLRKIRTFSDKLLHQHKDQLHSDGKLLLEKICVSASRMQDLLNDVISYTRLTENEEKIQQVDLEQCVEEVCGQLNEAILEKQATIHVGILGIIKGYPNQLNLLFYNLIENSLKFSKPTVPPVITILSMEEKGKSLDEVQHFLKVSVSDNGIGFEKKFSDKIFMIFQQLGLSNSKGKGIGLAICKRVMINHNGYIKARGEIDKGSVFDVYFPL